VISLTSLGDIAKDQGDDGRAARLFGAAQALRQALGASLSPAERARYEPDLAATRAALGEAAFEAASAEGRAMPPERAIDYALAAAGPGPAGGPGPPGPARQPPRLTAREREVAALIARGIENRQIAERLVIGEWTVETHVRHILGKLGFRSRAQVAAWAVDRGLLTPEPG
jgi:DNA-binding NarL/FixJ family response regulator